ncbi:MAG TPA: hypothetical protein VI758_03755 [Bacteroidota bacterium]
MTDRPVTVQAPVVVPTGTLTQSFARPPGKVYLLYGDDRVFPISLTMAAHAMAAGSSVAVVDGCNQFNVHLISRFARERKIDPGGLLRQIYISRGFTCYQMEQAVTDRLPAFLKTRNSSTAMIFGLLDTFFDEQASLREVQQILQRVLVALQTMKTNGVSVLVVCHAYNVLPEERNRLFGTLKTGMDQVYRLEVDDENTSQLFLEQTQPLAVVKRLGASKTMHGHSEGMKRLKRD